jgi:uncharacterized repeat protein (TIGR01451 family)
MERRQLLSIYVVTNTTDDGSTNSLRWAIHEVNSDSTADTIQFAIPAGGVQTIQLTSPLPTIVNPVLIDGTTESGYQGTPLIVVDGSKAGSGSNGLVLPAGGNSVRGLALVGFSGSAIVLNSLGGNVVEGNFLGVNASGTVADANGEGISIVGSSANTIGGGSAATANVISGNKGNGIQIESGSTGASKNLIYGNLIGTTADGLSPLGNQLSGVLINGVSANQIGLPVQGLGNIISGNVGPGIQLTSGASATVIQNNTIGVAEDGKTAVGNGGDGILIDDAPGTIIGGTEQGEANVIGCNNGNGINISGGSGALVSGNWIGTDLTGTRELGNRANGVNLASSSNTIGGTLGGSGNVIDFNGSGSTGSGVQLFGNVNQNAILSNSIYENAGLGINLGNGPTPNHPPGTPGPNDYQNYPVLSLAQSDGTSTTVQGTLSAAPSTLYLLQFFSSPTEDSTGFGQGDVLVGSLQVTTDVTGNVSFTAPVPVGALPGQYISATATDPSGNTSEFCLDVVTQGQINLVVSGTVAPSTVLAGGDVTYTIDVANQGNLDAHQVMLSDQLPSGVTVVSTTLSQGNVVSIIGGQIVAALGTVPAGTSVTATIVVQTGANSVGTITDTANVTSQEFDPNPLQETVSLTSTVLAAADLSIALTGNPNPVLLGADATFVMTMFNLGPDTANGVTASLPLGSGFAYVSSSATGGTVSDTGGQVGFALDDLGVNDQAVVTVVAQALTVGEQSETATVSSQAQDPNPANNSSSTTIQVNPASDLVVSIAASSSPVAPNIGFSYNVNVINNGPSEGSGIVVTDTLPAGVTFVSATSDQSVTPTQSNGVVTLTLATLQVGASANLTIDVIPTAAPGSTLVDSASVSSQTADPNPSNNTATLSTPVVGISDLAVSATAGASSVYAGQDLTYTVTVSNLGPNDEPDAVVTSQLPADVQLVSASTSTGGTPSVTQGGLLTADLGALPAGQSAVVTLVVAPEALTAETLTTSFAVQGPNVDPVSSNNSATVSVSVVPSADLAIVISPPGSAYATVASTYTLTVANLGPSDATGVTVLSSLPTNVTFISATSSQGPTPTDQAGVISADLGELDPGHSATVTLVLQPSATAAGSIVLPAAVSGDQFDVNLANNQASVTVPVAPAVNLAVSLVPTPQTVLSGHDLTFAASVTNTGPSMATNVVLDFPVGTGLEVIQCSTTQGSSSSSPGQLTANLGALSPGSSATVTVVFVPGTWGNITQSTSVTSSEYQINPQSATTTATATVLESAGVFQFSSATYAVAETAGVAILSVDRLDGALGAASVSYQTVAVNATPGLDFTPTSGTVSFAAGQTTATIQVPVLADPWDNHDEFVNVVLQSPTGGASLGSLSTASLRIIDVDPDYTPPQISQLSWTGTARAITGVTLSFTAPLNPTFAANPLNYSLIDLGAGNRPIALYTPVYNATNFTVTLVPTTPLADDQFYQIQVLGTGPTAIRDLAGNQLAGADNGSAGTNYVASFAQGNKLKYVDNAGNQVTLKLTGPGYLEQVRDASGEGESLTVMGGVAKRTTVSGSVRSSKRKSGRTNLGVIQGLGSFGAIKVKLASPPFFVREFPFMKRGRGVL